MFITLDCYWEKDNSYIGRQLNINAIYDISRVDIGNYSHKILVGNREYLIPLTSYNKLMRELNIPERQWL